VTQEESRTVLAVLSVSDGAQIDAALEDGLCCPGCGSRSFYTIQRGYARQVFDGEAQTGSRWSIDEPIAETNETISVSCAKCDALLFGEAP